MQKLFALIVLVAGLLAVGQSKSLDLKDIKENANEALVRGLSTFGGQREEVQVTPKKTTDDNASLTKNVFNQRLSFFNGETKNEPTEKEAAVTVAPEIKESARSALENGINFFSETNKNVEQNKQQEQTRPVVPGAGVFERGMSAFGGKVKGQRLDGMEKFRMSDKEMKASSDAFKRSMEVFGKNNGQASEPKTNTRIAFERGMSAFGGKVKSPMKDFDDFESEDSDYGLGSLYGESAEYDNQPQEAIMGESPELDEETEEVDQKPKFDN